MTLHLALMLHELGTNSSKYGALSGRGGRVTISWTVEDAVLRLRWVERGGPPVAAPTTLGFGTTLIERSARGEGGDAQMLCEAEGVTWNITMPLARTATSQILQQTRPGPEDSPSQPSQDGDVGKARASLAGRSFLVVEDEPLLALDVAEGLEAAGARVSGPVGTQSEALQLIEQSRFDAALLDANLHGHPVDEIAAALNRRNIPFAFVTGYGRESLPRAFRKTALLAKPFSRQELFEAATQLIVRTADVARLKL
jgi:CheY-like chemotaxis protein